MARKVQKADAPAANDSASSDAESLAELQPNGKLTIAGREIEIREYSFWEGLEVAHKASGFITDLLKEMESGDFRYTRVRRLIGVHRVALIPLVLQSAGVDDEWLESLSAEDKDSLLSAWYGVHVGFFVHEAVAEVQERLLLARAAAARSTGTTSSSASPAMDSGISTNSDGSPNGS